MRERGKRGKGKRKKYGEQEEIGQVRSKGHGAQDKRYMAIGAKRQGARWQGDRRAKWKYGQKGASVRRARLARGLGVVMGQERYNGARGKRAKGGKRQRTRRLKCKGARV